MKATSLTGLMLVLALVALPAASSGTIVFSAYADLDIYNAPCGGGFIKAIAGYHSGSVVSMDPGDSGRQFRLRGESGRCGLTTSDYCNALGTVGTNSSLGCGTYFEVGSGMCSVRTYEATSWVYANDAGGEEDTASSGCQSC